LVLLGQRLLAQSRTLTLLFEAGAHLRELLLGHVGLLALQLLILGFELREPTTVLLPLSRGSGGLGPAFRDVSEVPGLLSIRVVLESGLRLLEGLACAIQLGRRPLASRALHRLLISRPGVDELLRRHRGAASGDEGRDAPEREETSNRYVRLVLGHVHCSVICWMRLRAPSASRRASCSSASARASSASASARLSTKRARSFSPSSINLLAASIWSRACFKWSSAFGTPGAPPTSAARTAASALVICARGTA